MVLLLANAFISSSQGPRAFHSQRFFLDKVIGIDLGTTNSCVAVLIDDKPVVLENDGKRSSALVYLAFH